MMKFNFEKVFYYFLLIVVSGSVGYALKPETKVDETELVQKYENQQRVCATAIHMMADFSKKGLYQPKTKKELAIERMMKN